MRIGLVGAGMAGLACARRLADHGIQTTLFDKGRKPGGRLSTLSLDGFAWDFGAQYFTVSDECFAKQVAIWETEGLVAHWPTGPDGPYVPVPRMSALVEAQCTSMDVRQGAQVQRIESDAGAWWLVGPDFREGPFDAVVVAVPAEQAAALLSLHDLDLAREAAMIRSTPSWTLMAGFDEALNLPDRIATGHEITWAVRNSSKPGREDRESWVIQASADWSLQNLERDREEIAEDLLHLFAEATGTDLPAPSFAKAHRWRFALPLGRRSGPLWNDTLRMGTCGDWCMDGRIEGAWLSGVALADKIVQDVAA